MMFTRRTLGGASVAFLGHVLLGGLLPRTAQATTAVALALEDLVQESFRIALVTPTQASTAWESIGGQRRIVTRTTVLLQDVWRSADEPLASSEEDAQQMVVSTLGGRVGELQQKVHGEAALREGEATLVFAGRLRDGARRIVGMAQGHYPLGERDGQTRLLPSRNLPELLRRPSVDAAIDVLPALDLTAARRRIEAAR